MQRRRKVFSAEHAIFQDHPTTTLPWTADRSYSPRVTDYLAHHSSSGSASSSTTPPPGCHAPPPPLPPSTLHPPYSLYDPRRHRLLTHVDILSTGSNEKQLEEVITPTPPTPSVVVKRKLKRGGKGKEKEISTSDMAGSELSRLAPTTKTRSPRKRQEHQPIAPSPLKNDTSHTVASDHPSSQRSRKRKQNWLSLAEADEGVSEVENTITHPVIVNGRINRNAKGRVKRAAAGNTATSASTSEREGSIMSFSPHLETPSELPALDPLPPEVVAGGPSAQEQSQLEHNSEKPFTVVQSAAFLRDGSIAQNLPRGLSTAHLPHDLNLKTDQFPYHTGLVELNLRANSTQASEIEIAYAIDIPIGANA